MGIIPLHNFGTLEEVEMPQDSRIVHLSLLSDLFDSPLSSFENSQYLTPSLQARGDIPYTRKPRVGMEMFTHYSSE